MIEQREPAGGDAVPLAPTLLRLRFPAMERRPETVPGMIDQCNGVGRETEPDRAPAAIARGAAIYVSGWVLAPQRGGDAAEIVVTVDGAFAAVAASGHARPDVAHTHGDGAARSGFAALIPSHALEPGEHVLGVEVLHDATSYTSGPRHRIRIVNAALPQPIDTPVVPKVRVHIDALHDAGERAAGNASVPSLRSGATLSVTGWAADLAVAQPCAGVYALVDDVHLVRGRYAEERPDVAAALRLPQLHYCGFDVRIDTAAFGIGDHDVRVIALSANGAGRSEATPPKPFTVSPA